MNPILEFFECTDVPEKFQRIAEVFLELAELLDESLPDGPGKSSALRSLLLAKDYSVLGETLIKK